MSNLKKLKKFKEVDPAELAPVRALLIDFSKICNTEKHISSGEEMMDVVNKIASTTKAIYKIITKIHENDLKKYDRSHNE
jgi:hypothetical protein